MKKVLVFGASGLLGVSLVEHLMGNKHFQVFTHGNSKGDVSCRGDLTDFAKTSEILNQIKPDVIVNLTALTNVDECEENPQKAYLLNAKIIENTVKWIKENRSIDLIHISTDHLYDGKGVNSEEQIVLRNYYAYSKYLADLSALQVGGVVLRTNFFGKSHLPGRVSITDWIFNSINKEETINLFTDVFFTPLSMRTLCSMISHVMEKPVTGIYNLGSKEGLSKADFALCFSKILNIKPLKHNLVSVESLKFKAQRPTDMMMDVSKFEKTYQLKLPTLKEELDSIKKDYV